MTDDTAPPSRTINYPHPGDLDLDPVDVGPAAAGQLADSARAVREHAVATGRQVRSSYLSDLLADEPSFGGADPRELDTEWRASTTARLAGGLLAAAHEYAKAADRLAKHLEA